MSGKYDFKNKEWHQVLEGFDLERIREIPLGEKFKLVETIKMLAHEAEYANEHGYKNLVNSEYFLNEKTYRLICYLYVQDVDFEDIKSIVLNYLENYKFSDVYYAKFSFIGIGVMMMKLGRDAFSIFNALLILLGQEFLTYNLKLYGYNEALNTPAKVEDLIRYKEFEKLFREKKYKLLALGLMAKRDGFEAVEKYFDEGTSNEKAKIYFSLLSNMHDDLVYRSYVFLVKGADNMDKMIITGIYCLMKDKDIITSHYMMNSCIGKYDHSNQKFDRVKEEVEEIYHKMKGEIGLE